MAYTTTKEEDGKVLIEHTEFPPYFLPNDALVRQTQQGVEILNSSYQKIAGFVASDVSEVDDGDTQSNPTTPSELFEALKTVFSSAGSTATTTRTFVGVIDYADTSTASSPMDLSGLNLDTWVDVPNNGLGATSVNTVPGEPNIMNTSTGAFYFNELKQGARIDIRIDLTVTTVTPNTILRARLLQAVGDPLEKQTVFAHRYFKKVRTLDSYVFMTSFDVVSDAFYFNPTLLQVMADDDCEVINNGVRCWVTQ